jgi:hypothetical protein
MISHCWSLGLISGHYECMSSDHGTRLNPAHARTDVVEWLDVVLIQ